jgi:hypothetical protein
MISLAKPRNMGGEFIGKGVWRTRDNRFSIMKRPFKYGSEARGRTWKISIVYDSPTKNKDLALLRSNGIWLIEFDTRKEALAALYKVVYENA